MLPYLFNRELLIKSFILLSFLIIRRSPKTTATKRSGWEKKTLKKVEKTFKKYLTNAKICGIINKLSERQREPCFFESLRLYFMQICVINARNYMEFALLFLGKSLFLLIKLCCFVPKKGFFVQNAINFC